MTKEKVGLVLEGGGMRGAYTAGVLAWFLKEGYEFDYVVGISSGALYGSMFVLDKEESLKESSIKYATDKNNVGLKSLLNEGTLVGYDYMFDTLSAQLDYPLDQIDQIGQEIEIGVYDLDQEKTVWVDQKKIAQHPDYIKAACTLPVFGRAVEIEGKAYMDGGITTMIPVEKSIEKGCDKHIIITTKPADYVRKDQGFFQKHFLRFLYRKKPQLVADFENRRDVYYQERALIDELVAQDRALYLFPSQDLGVSRFGGDQKKFESLFQLALDDCEKRRGDFEKFLP